MHKLPLLSLLSALSASIIAQDPPPAPAPATPVLVERQEPKKATQKPVYDEAADAEKDVAAAVARAKKDNKRVLIQWGANWCGWCKWLAGTMQSNSKIAHELLYDYEVVHVDVGHFDKNLDLAKSLGAEFKGIPYLTILDADGKALVNQNTEPFEVKAETNAKDHHDPAKLLEWLTQYQPKAQVATEVLDAALAEAVKTQRRVFLHFGAPWCGWCHKLENWMAQPEIAALLAKDFVDVKIDNDRMVGAKDVYKAQLEAAEQKEGGIPWFVFLDLNGKLLAHSTGPKGNTGFPVEPEEIAHFVSMLNAVKVHLTDADIATLKASLETKAAPQGAPRPVGNDHGQ